MSLKLFASPGLIGNAILVGLGLVGGAVVNIIGPVTWLSISLNVVAAILTVVGGRDALATVFGLLPVAVQNEIALTFTILVAAGNAILGSLDYPPTGLTIGLSVLIALAGGIGIRSQVTPSVKGKVVTLTMDTAAVAREVHRRIAERGSRG